MPLRITSPRNDSNMTVCPGVIIGRKTVDGEEWRNCLKTTSKTQFVAVLGLTSAAIFAKLPLFFFWGTMPLNERERK